MNWTISAGTPSADKTENKKNQATEGNAALKSKKTIDGHVAASLVQSSA